MFRIFLGLCILSTVVATSVVADEPDAKGKNKNAKGKPRDKFIVDPEKLPDILLQRFDKNKDGKISKKEAEGRLAENFDRADKNKDGFIDRDELKTMVRLIAGAAEKGKGKFADKVKDRIRPGAVSLPDFDSLDKDADGRLTKTEIKGTSVETKFAEVDANNDGKIDPKEYKAYREKTEPQRDELPKDKSKAKQSP